MTKPIPSVLVEGPTRLIIHGNGPNRKRKVMVQTPQGIFSARRYYYALYHPDWNRKGKVIHLNNDDLDFSPDNLVCVTNRVANNLVHFNNNYISSSPLITRDVIKLIEAQILFKEVISNDKSRSIR